MGSVWAGGWGLLHRTRHADGMWNRGQVVGVGVGVGGVKQAARGGQESAPWRLAIDGRAAWVGLGRSEVGTRLGRIGSRADL